MENEKDSSLKAIDILEALIESNRDGMGLTEVAEKAGLSKSTVHRIMLSLAKRDYVIRNEATKKFHLGFKLLQFSNVILDQLPVRDVAHPYLVSLNEQFGESIHLIQRDGNQGIYIDKINCKYSVGLLSYVGKRVKLHTTAGGKLILAQMDPVERERILNEIGLEKVTESTISDRKKLEQELQACLSQGYAWNMMEDREDVIGIAAPIYDAHSKFVAAVAVAGPAYRFTKEVAEHALGPLREVTQTISAKLGYPLKS